MIKPFILTAFAAVVLLQSCNNSSTPSIESVLASRDTIDQEALKKEKELEAKKAFLNSYQSCKSSLNEPVKLESKDDVWVLHTLLRVYTEQILDYKNSKDPDIVKVYEDYKKSLVILQKEYYPLMRKAYLKEAKNDLFRHNIEVTSNKPNYTTIMFTGYLFANNANIEDVNNVLWSAIKKLRFKQVRYRWSEVDERYTYYDVKSPKDNEITLE